MEEAVVMPCGHRFSLEFLTTALAGAESSGAAPDGCLVCPLCGGIGGASKGGLGRTCIFSDSKRAYIGAVVEDWQYAVHHSVHA